MRHAVRLRIDNLREYAMLPRRMDLLETLLLESHDQHHERSQRRWAEAQPDTRLTFGRSLTGDAFIAKADYYGAFGGDKTVLEVGPGYGRLVEAAIRRDVAFENWVGIDLSPHNVAYLQGRFGSEPRISFVNADAGSMRLEVPVDTLLSSLTLKHVYPSFEPVLSNLASNLRAGGTIVVDLKEGRRRHFQDDGATYIRSYTRDEVSAIFQRCGCAVTAFDRVEHDADHVRLLVVGRRTS